MEDRWFTLGDLLFWTYLYPVQWIAAIVPVNVLAALARPVEPLLCFLARNRRGAVAARIAAGACKSPEEAAQIARRQVRRQLWFALDESALQRCDAARRVRCLRIEGLEHYQAALAEKNGIVLLCSHFYADRVATVFLRQRGESILSVHNQRPPNREGGRLGRALMRRFVELRHRSNPQTVYIQDPQCSLQVLRQLRAGGAVRIQIDGVPSTRSVEGRMLGRPRQVPAGIFDILRASRCAVVPMMAIGTSRGFEIRFSAALKLVEAATRDEFVRANLPLLLGAIEKQIVENPEEWMLWTSQ